ncbi:DUF4231 domain-containing protein [Kitasatospora sp. NPDC088346]|uniref:DUF4231 domain-containing protein n=1 Tax=Kitasatospora sp. NPDC088346 TaxID=3364073 RepID=UPI003806B11C
MAREADFWWADLRGGTGSALPPSVLQRITWYEKQAHHQRAGFYVSEIAIVLLSAAIPASAAAGASTMVAGVLGALVVAAVGLRQLYRWGENWIRSSNSLVALQGEVVNWSYGADPYSGSNADAVLAARVEAMVLSETTDWFGMLRSRATAVATTDGAQP